MEPASECGLLDNLDASFKYATADKHKSVKIYNRNRFQLQENVVQNFFQQKLKRFEEKFCSARLLWFFARTSYHFSFSLPYLSLTHNFFLWKFQYNWKVIQK